MTDTQYYGYDGQERLDTDPEDVIIYLLEGEEDYQDFPIKVYVFKPMNASKDIKRLSENLLRDLLENIDEDYSDPDGDYTKPTDAMLKAVDVFAKVVKDEYTPWMCEQTGEVLEFSKEEAFKIVGTTL